MSKQKSEFEKRFPKPKAFVGNKQNPLTTIVQHDVWNGQKQSWLEAKKHDLQLLTFEIQSVPEFIRNVNNAAKKIKQEIDTLENKT